MTFDFKRAPPEMLEREYARIADEIGDDRFFTRKELAFLPQILSHGEQVLAFTSGFMEGGSWLVTLTDRRIIFLDKGLLFGLKQTAIELDKVNSISGSTGLLFGRITVEDGASQRLISNVRKQTVTAFTNRARDAVQARKFVLAQGARAGAPDVVSQLERLMHLLERGAISSQEFQYQKRRLLSS